MSEQAEEIGKCPRCERPFDNARPKGVRIQLGWLVVFVCLTCVHEFLITPRGMVRPPRMRKRGPVSESTRKKMKAAWARRKAAEPLPEAVNE